MLEKKSFFLLILPLLFFLNSQCIKFDPKSARETPVNSMERAKKNVKEGRGVGLGNVFGNKNTNYEFSTSNSMWRATLEVLDFIPFITVDYSGGIIITDWYSSNETESIKITVRFLSNEISANNIKIIVHQKKCSVEKNCKINVLNSKIKNELLSSIVKKAAILEKEIKKN